MNVCSSACGWCGACESGASDVIVRNCARCDRRVYTSASDRDQPLRVLCDRCVAADPGLPRRTRPREKARA